jgi:repressor LexA
MGSKVIGNRKRREILDYIGNYVSEHGYAPSLREISAATDLGGPASVAYHLQVLADAKALQWQPGKARTIRLAEAA